MMEFRTKPVCASANRGVSASRTAARDQHLIALPFLIRSRDLNKCALLHCVAWIDGHLFAYFDTVENLHLDSVIATRLHSLEVDAPDASKHRRIDSPRSFF